MTLPILPLNRLHEIGSRLRCDVTSSSFALAVPRRVVTFPVLTNTIARTMSTESPANLVVAFGIGVISGIDLTVRVMRFCQAVGELNEATDGSDTQVRVA